MEKDCPGGATGQDAELDARLSAADRGMLGAIRDNLDLDTGFAQILGDLAGITPAGPPAQPAETEPGGRAHGYRAALDPVRACEVSGAARKIPAPAPAPKSQRETLHRHRTLITLALAVVAALNIAVLFSLGQTHGAVAVPAGPSATSPPFRALAGEHARAFGLLPPRLRQPIPLAGTAGASVFLILAADRAGIGDDPVITVISCLGDSRRGPVLSLSGFPRVPR